MTGNNYKWVGSLGSSSWQNASNWENATSGTIATSPPEAGASATISGGTNSAAVVTGYGTASALDITNSVDLNGTFDISTIYNDGFLNIVDSDIISNFFSITNLGFEDDIQTNFSSGFSSLGKLVITSIMDLNSAGTIFASGVSIAGHFATITADGAATDFIASGALTIDGDDDVVVSQNGADVQLGAGATLAGGALATDLQSSIEIGSLGNVPIGALSIDIGETVSGFGYLDVHEGDTSNYGTIYDNGVILSTSSILGQSNPGAGIYTDGIISGTGTIIIKDRMFTEFGFSENSSLGIVLLNNSDFGSPAILPSTDTIDIVGSNCAIDLNTGYYNSPTIDISSPIIGLNTNDIIDFTNGESVVSASYTQTVSGAGILELTGTAGSNVGSIALDGNYVGYSFPVTADQLNIEAPCYAAGTRIAKNRGEVAIENLRIGDLVRTAVGEFRPIKWIGHRSYLGRFVAGNRNILPILVKPGALGNDVPSRDLYLSPKHALFLEGVLIPAELLLNGKSVVQIEDVAEIIYFHLELETHDILLAEGAPAESFVDRDSRMMFRNAPEFFALYPAGTPSEDCAPRVEDGGVLEAVRQRIARRAGLCADHVGDMAAPGPLNGRVDILEHGVVSGWAFDAARPNTPVTLEVLANGRLVGKTIANRYRDDLRRAGKGSGRCAFECRLEPALSAKSSWSVQVRRADDHTLLLDAPVRLAADPSQPGPVDGRVDVCDAAAVEGWALDTDWPGIPVRLQLLERGEVIGQTIANRYRLDLEQAGKGDGRCGFVFKFDTPRDPRAITVRRASDLATVGREALREPGHGSVSRRGSQRASA